MKTTTAEVLRVKVMQEQEWAYARKLEHYSYREMAILTYAEPARGGLGYGLSANACRGLVAGYVERMKETLEDSAAETMARELADLDAQQRALMRLTSPIDEPRSMLVAKTLGFSSIEELAEHSPLNVVFRDDKVAIAALSQARAVGESRRKLLGTDAALKVDVTTHDGLQVELEEMLARAGAKPLTPEKKKA